MKEKEQRKLQNDFLNSDCGQFIFFLSEKGSVLISPWNKMVLGEKKNTCINAQQLDAGSYIDYWEITLNLSGEHTARPRKYILYYHFTFSMTQNHKYQSQMY